MLDTKEGSQEYFFVRVFCTTVKALGLQVRSMHGAVPPCAAHGARECETCTHKHTHTQHHNIVSPACISTATNHSVSVTVSLIIVRK